MQRLAEVFGEGAAANAMDRAIVHDLHAKIGELIVERDFVAGALGRYPGTSGRR